MTQSEVIAGALFAGFLLWLAMNKRLPAYWSILTGGGASPAAAGGSGGGGSGSGSATPPAPGSGSGSGGGYLVPPIPSIGFPGVKGLF
jgi:hypothetical protein